jgi:enoyl-CoA hydratase
MPEPVVKEMALFGNRISADRALAIGFVAAVDADPSAAAMGLVERAVTLSPRAVEIAKSMLHAAIGEDRGAMIEALGSAAIAASDDRAEGVAAFQGKRKADFSGR